jgi:outer membrane lipoprotein-sorting protein
MTIKRFRKGAVLILTGFFCLAFFRPVFSQETTQPMTAEQVMAGVSQKWGNIKDFQGDMTIGMQMFGKMMKMEGTVWAKDKLFRTEMTLPPEMMPSSNKPAAPIKLLMVFDGKTMWQMLPMMNMVTKIEYSALEGKIKNMPSGFHYSLPAVSYKLSEKKRNETEYYLLETNETNKFIQNSPVSAMGANLPTTNIKSISVWVNKATLFPDLMEFYFQDNTAPGMYLEFKNVKTDQGLAPELFTFQVPEGMQVMDMTASIKAMAGKREKQSTAPDTAQQSATTPDTGQVSQ